VMRRRLNDARKDNAFWELQNKFKWQS